MTVAGTPSPRVDKRQLVLAVSLVLLELLAGMQTYLSQMVMPMMAASLHAQRYYGLVNGTSLVFRFLFLPLGALLLMRVPISRLLAIFTAMIVAGGIVSATAPSIWVYLLGRVLAASAGGAIAVVNMGAVSRGLTGGYRRMALAFSSASWVFSALVGPAYAAWATAVFSWRWAMLMYLPLLLVGRIMVARQLPPPTKRPRQNYTVGDAVVLAVGVALLSVPLGHVWSFVAMGVGLGLMLVASVRLLPSGTFGHTTNPRIRAITTLYGITGGYFAADALIAVVAHDQLRVGAARIGTILLAGGVTWGLVGLWCGARPAKNYPRRALAGELLICLGLMMIALTVSDPRRGYAGMLVGWAIAGVGMGLVYVDTLNIAFDEELDAGSLSGEEAGAATVMVESIASAITTTLFLSIDTRPTHHAHLPVALFTGATVICALTSAIRIASHTTQPTTQDQQGLDNTPR